MYMCNSIFSKMTSIYVFNITHLDWIKLVDELTPLMLPVEEQDENTGQKGKWFVFYDCYERGIYLYLLLA